MKKILLFKITISLAGLLLLSSCGSSRSRVITTKSESKSESSTPSNHTPSTESENHIAFKIIETAQGFEGTRYKYGGTNSKGMDCSGLVYISFLEQGISLPRNSRAMSLEGIRLFLNEVAPGDLLFFETNKNRKVINHVGIVVKVNDKGVYFIHSSSSRGVIISSLSETYWQNNFVMARRVI